MAYQVTEFLACQHLISQMALFPGHDLIDHYLFSSRELIVWDYVRQKLFLNIDEKSNPVFEYKLSPD